jgi:Ca2+-transporting ATPase
MLVREYPLRPELPAKTRAWRSGHGDLTIASKGAPEAIATLCRLSAGEAAALRARVDALAAEGARVLAVARGAGPITDLPDAHAEVALTLLGLVAFADPLRETVPEAVRECHSAGVRVVMITGDYPETARAIARRAGIDDGAVLTGAELERMDDRELMTRARSASVFARITPQQKLRIVNALKADGQVVAMTGDGVNDAHALKAAHIGIAMGGRGNDVAREASSIVLLDDDFGSIVRAIRLGRRIYDNLQKAMAYIFAIHIPIAGVALLPLVLGWPLVLTPMLIALLELIIDPACSIVLEAEQEEADVMRRPPRAPGDSLLSPGRIASSAAQGLMALGVVLLLFVPAVAGMTENQARALVFVTLVGVNLALIFANRTFSASIFAALVRPNTTLWWGLGFVACAMTLIFSWTELRNFFDLEALRASDIAYSLGAAGLLLAALELLKLITPPYTQPPRGRIGR